MADSEEFRIKRQQHEERLSRVFDEVMGLGEFADSSRGSASSSRSGGQNDTQGVDETSGTGEHPPVEEDNSNGSRQEEKTKERTGESSFPGISTPSSDRPSSFTMRSNEEGGGGSGGAAFDNALDGLPSFEPEDEDEDWHFSLPLGSLEEANATKAKRKGSQPSAAPPPREEEEEQDQEGSSGSANTSHSSQDPTTENSRDAGALNQTEETEDSQQGEQSEAAPVEDSNPPTSPAVNIKDEPIDEGYDAALLPQSSIKQIKEELEQQEEELRISSVYSVGGGNTFSTPTMPAPVQAHPPPTIFIQGRGAVLQAMAPLPVRAPAPVPTSLHALAAMPPRPPPPAVPGSVRCSGCSKVLLKGQTAFQRKGSTQLFCSTVCLTGHLPPAPKNRSCFQCNREIIQPRDMITIPADDSTLMHFCGQFCLSVFRHKRKQVDILPDKRQERKPEKPPEKPAERQPDKPFCSVCKVSNRGIEHEVTHQGRLHRLCSDACFVSWRKMRQLAMNCCEGCGLYCNSKSGSCQSLTIDRSQLNFCGPTCIGTYKQNCRKTIDCAHCRKLTVVSSTIMERDQKGKVQLYCSPACVERSRPPRHTLTGGSIPEHISLSRTEKMLNAIVGDNSDVEDMSDEDDDPGVEQLSSEDPIPPYSPESDQQSCDDSNAESQLHLHASKRHSGEREEEACERDERDDHLYAVRPKRRRGVPRASKDGDRECWDSAPFIPDLVQFEAADKRLHEREDWQPLDYVEQYIDTELITRIAKCTNAMSAGHSGGSLHSDTNEIFHFFGASILLSCVPYPEVRIFWSSALRISAICDKFPLERFLELSQHLKVVVDDYIFSDQRREDKFWKIRPFMDRILKGCWRQVRPEYVLITEQIIPFKGACPFRQHVPLKPQALGMRTFVLASPDGIVLDFEVYQGANAHRSSQAQDTEGLGLAALVIKRLAKDLQPGTKLYCDCFFTTVKAVDQMLKKKVYLTGPVMESRVNKALKKLPSNLHMKQDRRCASAVATRSDGKVCVVKWYDNKPNLMLSAAHAEQPGDTIQQWSRKDKQYLTVTRPSIVREYQSKMSGVELLNKVMANYPMTLRTQKWTIQILMHLTDLALANSWLLYCADHTEQGTQREDLMQYIDFRVAVALAFLAKGETPQVTPVPHVSAGTTSVTHLPEMVTLKNAAWCRATGCTEKSCVRCVTCDAFLCLKPERNCYAVFHTGRQV